MKSIIVKFKAGYGVKYKNIVGVETQTIGTSDKSSLILITNETTRGSNMYEIKDLDTSVVAKIADEMASLMASESEEVYDLDKHLVECTNTNASKTALFQGIAPVC